MTPRSAAQNLKGQFCVFFGLILLFVNPFMNGAVIGQTGQSVESARNPQEVAARLLLPGQVLKVELAGGQAHTYQVNLKAGEFLHVEVIQTEIDVIVSIFAPDGRLLVSMDSLDGRLWRLAVSCVAQANGTHRLEVRAREKESLPGSYTIHFDALRTPTPRDLRRIAGERLMIDGLNFWKQRTNDALANALKKYVEARAVWAELGDSQWEAMSLTNLGLVCAFLGQKDQALELLNKAISLYKKTGDRMGEGKSLRALAGAYYYSSENEKSNEYLERALAVFRELRSRRDELVTVISLGSNNLYMSQFEKARDYYEQSLRISREIKDRRGESDNLTGLGLAYDHMSQYEKALEYQEKALVISREIKDRNYEQRALINLGASYMSLNDYERALGLFHQALPMVRESGSRWDESHVLNNIGYSYLNLGQHEKAREYLELALQAERESKNRTAEVYTLSNLAALSFRVGKFEKSEEYYTQALVISRDIKGRSLESIALTQLGNVYVALGKTEKAREYYNQALFIRREIKELSGEGETLTKMMQLWQTGIPRLAILYGKQAVNIYQQIRGNIRGLDRDTRRTYVASITNTYRTLADLLVAAGRLPEAEQVLKLLKDEEYFEFVRRDNTAVKGLFGRIDLTPDEEKAIKRYLGIADRVTSLGVEIETLSKQKAATPEEKSKIESQLANLRKDIEAANITFNAVLREIQAEFSQSTRKDEQVVALMANRGLRADLREWGAHTVVLSTIVGEKTYRVILTTPSVQIAGAYDIKQEELNKLVLEFREAVQNPCACVDSRPLGQRLYQILLGPIEKQLDDLQSQAGQQPLTVVWSLDGTLRYLPIAALWDGKRYLVERYRNAVMTLASRTRIGAISRKTWRGLGLGVSEPKEILDFASNRKVRTSALPAVPSELNNVIRDERTASRQGIVPGHILLDSKFTERAMTQELRSGGFSLVHIASHFFFQPGDERQSFLLLGDGDRITLQQIRNAADLQFAGVELLTLSACNTAIGGVGADGKEIEGFAVLAQEQGAKAVLAALWPVADTSTQLLMTELYRQRQTYNLAKAEALRRAQVGLLNGKVKATNPTKTRADLRIGEASQTTYKADRLKPYAHPYYWAPFILIGNWR